MAMRGIEIEPRLRVVVELTLMVELDPDRPLYAVQERCDRRVAATAIHLDLPLISRDRALGTATGVRTIW